MVKAAFLLLLAFLVWGCHKDRSQLAGQPDAEVPVKPEPLASVKADPTRDPSHVALPPPTAEKLNELTALQLLLPGKPVDEGMIRWGPGRTWLKRAGFEPTDSEVYSRPVKGFVYTQQSIPRFLLIVGTAPLLHGCHFCRPAVGAAFFSRISGTWRVDAQNLLVGSFGTYGEVPTPALEDLGPEHKGIILMEHVEGMGQEHDALSLIGEANGTVSALLGINEFHGASDGSAADVPKFKYTSRLSFESTVTDGRYDVKVVTAGSRVDDSNKVVSADATRRFSFTPQGYKP